MAKRKTKKPPDDEKLGSLAEEARVGATRLARAIFNEQTGKIVLRPDQQAAYRARGYKVKVLNCGRRWGKTTYCSVEALESAQVPDSLVWWTSPTYNQGSRPRMVLEYITERLGWLQKPTKHYLRLRNNSQISFRSVHDASSLRGEGVNRIILDEACLFKESDYTDVLAPMLFDTHGDAILASTPGPPRGFFYDMYQAGLPGPRRRPWVKSFHFPSTENPILDQEWLNIHKNTWPERYQREILAEFVELEDIQHVFDVRVRQSFTNYNDAWNQEDASTIPAILAIDGAGVGKVGWVYGEGCRILHSGAYALESPGHLFDWSERMVVKYHPDIVTVDSTSMTTGLYQYLSKVFRERKTERAWTPKLEGCNFTWGPFDGARFANWRTENLFLARDMMIGGEIACREADNRELLRELETTRVSVTDTMQFRAKPKQHKGETHNEDAVDALIMYCYTLQGYYRVHGKDGPSPEPFDVVKLFNDTRRRGSSRSAAAVLLG